MYFKHNSEGVNCENRNISERFTDWVSLIQTANSAMEAD